MLYGPVFDVKPWGQPAKQTPEHKKAEVVCEMHSATLIVVPSHNRKHKHQHNRRRRAFAARWNVAGGLLDRDRHARL